MAEEPRLGSQVGAEVRERRDDRSVHRVERRAIDGVGEQDGIQRVVPCPPAVEHACFALDAVHRRGQRDRHRLPGFELGFVRGLAGGRVR